MTFDFIRDWLPHEQAAGLVDLALAFHEAASNPGHDAEARKRLAEIRAYLDTLDPPAELEQPPAPSPKPSPTPTIPTPPEPAPNWQECLCGKRGYPSPKAARQGSATNGLRVRVYQCPKDHRLHHITKSKHTSKRRRKKYREGRGAIKARLETERRKDSR